MNPAKLLAAAIDDSHGDTHRNGARAGANFAGHRLIEELGRGGMGVVFTACHLASNRIVALKVPHANATPETLRRFCAETEAVAALSHPGILAVHEVGEIDGVPFFTMQFAECGSLAERLADFAGKPRVVAELLIRIAGAVQHAHERGLLHRDLKPSNILLATPDQPLVADFGLARWLARESDLTDSLAVLGTPDYLAPEAVRGARHALTTAADVFSLGAILHHLLAGRAPFAGGSVAETLANLSGTDPAPVLGSVPRDLAAICAKCLDREPARRFASAGELAEDLARFLRGEPVRARVAPPLEKAWRWCRRRPALAGLLALFVVVAAVAVALIETARRAETAAKIRAENVSQQLREASARIQHSLDLSELERAEEFFQSGDSAQGVALLARVVRRNPAHPTAGQRLTSALWHGDFIQPHGPPIFVGAKLTRLDLLKDGTTLLLVTESSAGLWDTAAGKWRIMFEHDGSNLTASSMSADEGVLVAWDHRVGGTYSLWETATGRRLRAPVPHSGDVQKIGLSPDGSRLLVAGGETPAHLRETRSGEPVGAPMPHSEPLSNVAFDPTGQLLATAAGRVVRLWEMATQQLRGVLPESTAPADLLRFSADGRFLLVTLKNGAMRLFSTVDGQPAGTWMRHEDVVNSIVFTADGRRFISASDDHTARVWSVPEGEALSVPLRHRDALPFATFSPDGARIVTCSRDNSSRLWDATNGRPLSQPLRTTEQSRLAAFTPDGSTVFIGGAEAVVQQWDAHTAHPAPTLLDSRDRVRFAEFSADGKREVTAGESGRAIVWDASGKISFSHDGAALVARFSADGQRLAIGTAAKKVWVHDLTSDKDAFGQLEPGGAVLDVCFSPDGKWLATATEDGAARIWDVAARTTATAPLQHAGRVESVRFSPDGHAILTASADHSARLWNAATGAKIGSAMHHDDGVSVAEFSPDGRLVATASRDNTARVWDAQTGAAVSPPMRLTRTVIGVAFSPDGTSVVTASWDGTARIWEARTGHPLTPPMIHDDHVTDAQFSPDGRRIVTASRDKTVRLWNAATGLPICEPFRHPGAVLRARFAPDSLRILTTCNDAAHIWEAPDFSSPAPDWLIDLSLAVASGTFAPASQPQGRIPRSQISPESAFGRLFQQFHRR